MSTAEAVSASQLDLSADLGIERVTELRAQLLPLLATPRLSLDAGAVARVHSAALQVLAAFTRDRRAAGHETKWRAPSTVLLAAARQLALMPHLQIEEN